MKSNKELRKGSVVRYKDGYYSIKACFKNTANLANVWNTRSYDKGVPLDLLEEAHDEWYETWTKSETYMCM